MNRVYTADTLNKAYRLAYFLHQDKDIAIRIVVAATLKLNVAMAVQTKRLTYTPVGRVSHGESRRSDGIRNKALFSDLHLLQRLIYGESEPYERQKERAATGVPTDGDPAREEDLLVYFIKHLVKITTKRNAFYVTLGVSRLLHNYSTVETMEIYNAVIGEPERAKDDYYYRSRKAILMHEMYQRFGELIRACRHRGGEERFETQQGSNELRSLMGECLRLFTPWDTQCSVPNDFDPFKSVIASLTSKSNADENEVEVNRIHAVLHPECFERLVAAFGYRSPEERMELPRFFMDQADDQSPPRPRSAPAELSAEELAEINHIFDEQAGRRRRSSPTGVIRIMVDGVERARLNPVEQSSISFSVDEDAEIIEVKTTDSHGDLLLATHLLTSFEIVSSIRLEGGQDLSLSITRRQSEPKAELLVKFGYRETELLRAVRLWWQRLMLRFRLDQGLWGGVSARHVVVGGVLVVCVAGFLGYVMLRSRETEETRIAQTIPVESVPRAPVREAPTSQPPPVAKRERSPAARAPSAPVPAPARDEDAAASVLRSGNVVPDLKLSEVKKIYVEIRGDAAADEIRSNIAESLESSGIATTNAEEADAALKITVSRAGVSAQLVNARGTVLWRTRRYTGDTNKILPEIVKDLLAEITRARGQ
ncbi:MAG TPA: hypothetical protein VFR78_03715 [Pyrinomonadaceae bacterium]|nr:hypothetical protein [Pyrinomonadaceae bacterium]